jgi:NAD(P)-dependent dehydrogenase (short-subunit alcohol dehydrogenase family)
MHATFHDLKDASVFITGGGSGIGAAITEGFAAQGARVAFADIVDAGALCDAVAERHGTPPLALTCDVTDTAALKATLDTAAAAHGDIEVLENLAAYDDRHDTLSVTEDYWRMMLSRNLDHIFFASQHVIPAMRKAGRGRIVNFSSISYMLGMADYPAYTAAKSAINALSRGMAREFGADGIRVNAIMPGWVLTPRQIELWGNPEALAAYLPKQSIPRHLSPDDMVGPVLFLASDASRMMTGQALVVDGGVVVTG